MLLGRKIPLLARSILAGTVLALVFAIAGALVGLLTATLESKTYSSSAEVYTQPTPTLENSNPTPTTQDANDLFMGSQVEAVSSLTENLPGKATVTVGQIGLTSVLQITATASTSVDAVSAANEVLDRYIAQRKQQVTDYASDATGRLKRQLDADTKQLAALRGSNAAKNAQTAALTADYSRLLSQQRQVELTSQTARPTSVIHNARSGDTTANSNAIRNTILGVLIGLAVGVAVVAAVRLRAAELA